jgi:endonuclease YncB( thermonuclease family)
MKRYGAEVIFMSAFAYGREVNVEVRGRDRNARTVADVILPDGRNLNHEIVKAGFAWWYSKYVPHTLKANWALGRVVDYYRPIL